MVVSVFFVFTRRGEIISYKNFDSAVSRTEVSEYKASLIASKIIDTPITLQPGGTSYIHKQHNDVYCCLGGKGDMDIALSFEYLNSLIKIFEDIFGKLCEDSLKDNFTSYMLLLEETCEFGVVQQTNPSMLAEILGISANQHQTESDLNAIAIQATGQISWRPRGIEHDLNTIFLDIIEECNILVSQTGEILNSEITGAIEANSVLSGMPDCRLGLNDQMWLKSMRSAAATDSTRPVFDQWSFHQCVRLSELESERAICFIPPDGEFTLMNYRVNANEFLPFKVSPLINQVGSKYEYRVTIESDFSNINAEARQVIVKIPVPHNAASADISVSQGGGKARFEPENGGMVWRILAFENSKSFVLTALVHCLGSGNQKVWDRPPISVEFILPGEAASGLHVEYLKVVSSEDDEAQKKARYITKASENQYLIRL
ncbi:hypothetical protein PCE1_003492 [Barthelona sp. PCE]